MKREQHAQIMNSDGEIEIIETVESTRQDHAITEEHRCTGHCCRHFFIPYTYNELQKMLDPTNNMRRCEDYEIIARMVIPAEVPEDRKGKEGCEPEYCFTCRHLLSNGDCLIYHARPKMCREYPYGRRCNYPGCTYTGTGETHNEVNDA